MSINAENNYLFNLAQTCQKKVLIHEDGGKVGFLTKVVDFFLMRGPSYHFQEACKKLAEYDFTKGNTDPTIKKVILDHFSTIQAKLRDKKVKLNCEQYLRRFQTRVLSEQKQNLLQGNPTDSDWDLFFNVTEKSILSDLYRINIMESQENLKQTFKDFNDVILQHQNNQPRVEMFVKDFARYCYQYQPLSKEAFKELLPALNAVLPSIQDKFLKLEVQLKCSQMENIPPKFQNLQLSNEEMIASLHHIFEKMKVEVNKNHQVGVRQCVNLLEYMALRCINNETLGRKMIFQLIAFKNSLSPGESEKYTLELKAYEERLLRHLREIVGDINKDLDTHLGDITGKVERDSVDFSIDDDTNDKIVSCLDEQDKLVDYASNDPRKLAAIQMKILDTKKNIKGTPFYQKYKKKLDSIREKLFNTVFDLISKNKNNAEIFITFEDLAYERLNDILENKKISGEDLEKFKRIFSETRDPAFKLMMMVCFDDLFLHTRESKLENLSLNTKNLREILPLIFSDIKREGKQDTIRMLKLSQSFEALNTLLIYLAKNDRMDQYMLVADSALNFIEWNKNETWFKFIDRESIQKLQKTISEG